LVLEFGSTNRRHRQDYAYFSSFRKFVSNRFPGHGPTRGKRNVYRKHGRQIELGQVRKSGRDVTVCFRDGVRPIGTNEKEDGRCPRKGATSRGRSVRCRRISRTTTGMARRVRFTGGRTTGTWKTWRGVTFDPLCTYVYIYIYRVNRRDTKAFPIFIIRKLVRAREFPVGNTSTV